MPTDDHSVCKIAWINFTSTTPQQEEALIFHSFHLDTTWEHPLKHTLSLLLKLGMIITIRISLHWTRLSTAAAHKASRADKSHAYNKGLLEFFFPRSKYRNSMSVTLDSNSFRYQRTWNNNESCTYVFSTCVTVLCIKGLEAVAAVWSSILHDVALPAKGGLTLVATEMLHVPVPALRLSALISKDDLYD